MTEQKIKFEGLAALARSAHDKTKSEIEREVTKILKERGDKLLKTEICFLKRKISYAVKTLEILGEHFRNNDTGPDIAGELNAHIKDTLSILKNTRFWKEKKRIKK